MIFLNFSIEMSLIGNKFLLNIIFLWFAYFKMRRKFEKAEVKRIFGDDLPFRMLWKWPALEFNRKLAVCPALRIFTNFLSRFRMVLKGIAKNLRSFSAPYIQIHQNPHKTHAIYWFQNEQITENKQNYKMKTKLIL